MEPVTREQKTIEIYARLQDAAKELANIARELDVETPGDSGTAAIHMVCCGLAGMFLAPHRLPEDLPIFVAAASATASAHVAEADQVPS